MSNVPFHKNHGLNLDKNNFSSSLPCFDRIISEEHSSHIYRLEESNYTESKFIFNETEETKMHKSKSLNYLISKENSTINKREFNTIECQTDFKLDPFSTKSIPSFSEIESIGIYYLDGNTALSLSDDETFSVNDDKCVQYEYYKREAVHNQNTRPKQTAKYRSSTTQTLFTIVPDTHRSTQTSPSLIKNFVLSNLAKSVLLPYEFCLNDANDNDSIHYEEPLCEDSCTKYAELCRDTDWYDETLEIPKLHVTINENNKSTALETNQKTYDFEDGNIEKINTSKPSNKNFNETNENDSDCFKARSVKDRYAIQYPIVSDSSIKRELLHVINNDTRSDGFKMKLCDEQTSSITVKTILKNVSENTMSGYLKINSNNIGIEDQNVNDYPYSWDTTVKKIKPKSLEPPRTQCKSGKLDLKFNINKDLRESATTFAESTEFNVIVSKNVEQFCLKPDNKVIYKEESIQSPITAYKSYKKNDQRKISDNSEIELKKEYKKPTKLYLDWNNLLDLADDENYNETKVNGTNGAYIKQSKHNDTDHAGTEADIDDNDDIETNSIKVNSLFCLNKLDDPKKHADLDDKQIDKRPHVSQHKIMKYNLSTNTTDSENQDEYDSKRARQIEPKIFVSSVIPQVDANINCKPKLSKHLEQTEIKPLDGNNRLIEVSGYNPQNGSRLGSRLDQVNRSEILKSKSQTNVYNSNMPKQLATTSVENIHEITRQPYEEMQYGKIRHQSGADSSSVITEASMESRIFDNNSSINASQYNEISNGKLTRIQKIMANLAEKEYQKIKRRIERRKERIPEIMSLLSSAKGKEKKKLEEELRVLLRKAEKDEKLLKKFQSNESLRSFGSMSTLASKKQDIDADDAFKTNPDGSLKSNLKSNGKNYRANSDRIYNDGYSSADGTNPKITKLRVSGGTTRESGYSSCEESGAEVFQNGLHRRCNSYGSLDLKTNIRQNLDDNQTPMSSILKSAIKLTVDKMPIDSSNITTPATSKRLPSPQKHIVNLNAVKCADKNVLNHLRPTPIIGTSSSKLNDLSLEYVPYESLVPIDIGITSGESSANRRNLRNQDDFDSTKPSRHPRNKLRNGFIEYGRSNGSSIPTSNDTYSVQSHSQPSGDATTRSTNFQAPISDQSNQFNQSELNYRNTDDFSNSSNNFYSSSNDKNDYNENPNTYKNIKKNAHPEVQYIYDTDLDSQLLRTLNLQYDPQTHETFFVDEYNNIKYIILRQIDDGQNDNNMYQDPNLQVEYIEQRALDGLDNATVYQDQNTGEFCIDDPVIPSKRWIVLPDNWHSIDDSPYISEDDIDISQWDVYLEENTNRKYIVDEKNGKRYYIIEHLNNEKFHNDWVSSVKTLNSTRMGNEQTVNDYSSRFHIKWPTNNPKSKKEDEKQKATSRSNTFSSLKNLVRSKITQTGSNDLLTVKDDVDSSSQNTSNTRPEKDKSDSLTNSFLVDYVEEGELYDLNLNDIAVFQDPITNESYIQDPNSTNHIWVILPDDWQESEFSLYVSDEDVDILKWDTYIEENTNRKYIVDEKTGNRYFIVPTIKNQEKNFQSKWKTPTQTDSKLQKLEYVNDKHSQESGKSQAKSILKSKDFSEPQSFVKASFGNKAVSHVKNKNDDEVIKTLDYEPKRFELRKPGAQKNQNEELTLAIKQKSKPGHLIHNNRLKIGRPINQINKIALSQVLPGSPRPLHHFLLTDHEKQKRLNELYDKGKKNEESATIMDKNSIKWRSFNDLDDPTASKNGVFDKSGKLTHGLDRNRLAEVQIYGYRVEPKKKRGRSLNTNNYDSYSGLVEGGWSASSMPYTPSHLTGVLTERFKEQNIWQRNHRSVGPKTRLHLKEQILATPHSQIQAWNDTLKKSYKLKPRIILIDDEEHILSADRKCKMYVQYMHEHDSVLGADPAYMLMLPNRGPVHPTRPLMVTPKQLDHNKSDIALREAPVFVYHRDGSAYFENIAQYLSGNSSQLSPKTVRKILQFEDIKEFEEYLESKIAREEAKRISELSGDIPIDIEEIKRDLLKTVSSKRSNTPHYYHPNCEYDALRNENSYSEGNQDDSTRNVEIDGARVKSTFISFTPTGNVERLPVEELPNSLITAMRQAENFERSQEMKNEQSKYIRQNIQQNNPSRLKNDEYANAEEKNQIFNPTNQRLNDYVWNT